MEEQVNEAAVTLPLRAVNMGKPLAEVLEGTSNDSKSLTLARPARDRDAVANGGVVTKGRCGKRKHICCSTNTRNGNPFKHGYRCATSIVGSNANTTRSIKRHFPSPDSFVSTRYLEFRIVW